VSVVGACSSGTSRSDGGGAWVLDRLSTSDPGGIDFEDYTGNSIGVLLDRALERPDELFIELTRWPRRKLKAYWDGDRWGSRGSGASGPPDVVL
jgi:hypothetical protein